MDGIRPDRIRAETVRKIDAVLQSIADGRLDRDALRKLPGWRAVVLARIAHRARLMPREELDGLTAEAVAVGVDQALDPSPAVEELPEVEYIDGAEWTKSGMIKKSVRDGTTGSRRLGR